MFSVQFFTDDFRRAYTNLSENARQEMRAAIVDWCIAVVMDAKATHIFQNRTGTLEASIDAIVWGGGSKIIADTDYAVYVITGHGTWEGDPFLQNAVEDYLPELQSDLVDRIKRLVEE